MSGGTFSVSRGIWDHPAFRSEPFTEREAWLWLCSEASWKPRVVRFGDAVANLERGQLAASVRFCASAWKWTAAKAQRYLAKLEKLKMIRRETDTGVTVITISNYDKFQANGCATDTAAIQHRYSTDTNEKKGERREKEGEEDTCVSLPVHPANDLSHAVSRYNDAADKAGWPKVQKLSPNRSKQLRARLAECGGVEGWEVALRKAFDSDFCRGRTPKPWTGFAFDWLVKAGNFTKLMEGNYDNRANEHRPASAGPNNAGASLASIVAKRRAQQRH